jgi:hypothetical protein
LEINFPKVESRVEAELLALELRVVSHKKEKEDR